LERELARIDAVCVVRRNGDAYTLEGRLSAGEEDTCWAIEFA
jgi:hypothetical protein